MSTDKGAEFPFENLDQLIEEENSLPPIPNWPSIWTKKNNESE